jgi:hypothetical protein
MSDEPAKANIRDILNYQVESYITEDDVRIIREHFKDNPILLQVIRKVFMPSISYAQMPVEELGKDMWFAGVDFSTLSKDEAYVRILARQEAIKFIVGGMISLKQISNISEEDDLNRAARRQKDSSK